MESKHFQRKFLLQLSRCYHPLKINQNKKIKSQKDTKWTDHNFIEIYLATIITKKKQKQKNKTKKRLKVIVTLKGADCGHHAWLLYEWITSCCLKTAAARDVSVLSIKLYMLVLLDFSHFFRSIYMRKARNFTFCSPLHFCYVTCCCSEFWVHLENLNGGWCPNKNGLEGEKNQKHDD